VNVRVELLGRLRVTKLKRKVPLKSKSEMAAESKAVMGRIVSQPNYDAAYKRVRQLWDHNGIAFAVSAIIDENLADWMLDEHCKEQPAPVGKHGLEALAHFHPKFHRIRGYIALPYARLGLRGLQQLCPGVARLGWPEELTGVLLDVEPFDQVVSLLPRLKHNKAQHEKAFQFLRRDWSRLIALGLKRLKLNRQLVLYLLRHSGASNDSYHKRRNLREIKRRSRLLSDRSFRRYEKSTRLTERLS
jgi:hypothetical protein